MGFENIHEIDDVYELPPHKQRSIDSNSRNGFDEWRMMGQEPIETEIPNRLVPYEIYGGSSDQSLPPQQANPDATGDLLAAWRALPEDDPVDTQVEHHAAAVETKLAEPLMTAGEHGEAPNTLDHDLKTAHDVGETVTHHVFDLVEHRTDMALSPREKRVETIFAAVDPEKKLPKVHLKADTQSAKALQLATRSITRKVAYDDVGNEVGEIQIKNLKYASNVKEIAFTHTSKPGQGFGMSIYLEQIASSVRANEVITSDSNGVTEDAKKVWDKLAAVGVATVRKPFELANPGEYYAHYDGSAVVRPYDELSSK